MVQNLALPKPFQTNSSSLKEDFEKDTYHPHPYNHHIINKRSVSRFDIRNKSHINGGTKEKKHFQNIPKPATPDPLLVELFASTNLVMKK